MRTCSRDVEMNTSHPRRPALKFTEPALPVRTRNQNAPCVHSSTGFGSVVFHFARRKPRPHNNVRAPRGRNSGSARRAALPRGRVQDQLGIRVSGRPAYHSAKIGAPSNGSLRWFGKGASALRSAPWTARCREEPQRSFGVTVWPFAQYATTHTLRRLNKHASYVPLQAALQCMVLHQVAYVN